MIASAILEIEQSRDWWRFWQRQSLGHLRAEIEDDVAHIFDDDDLVAEFTPENTPEFITETLEQLKKEI